MLLSHKEFMSFRKTVGLVKGVRLRMSRLMYHLDVIRSMMRCHFGISVSRLTRIAEDLPLLPLSPHHCLNEWHVPMYSGTPGVLQAESRQTVIQCLQNKGIQMT